MKEADIVRACVDLLRFKGAKIRKIHTVGIPIGRTGAFRTNPMKGISDIIGWLPSCKQHKHARFLAVEVKMAGKKPTLDQLEYLAELNEDGGLGIWVTSAEELLTDLEKEGY